MKDPREEGVANHSAPSFARPVARHAAKRKQGNRWAGCGAPKSCNQGADVLTSAEGHMTRGDSASLGAALRSLRPETRRDTFCIKIARGDPRARCPTPPAWQASTFMSHTRPSAITPAAGGKGAVHAPLPQCSGHGHVTPVGCMAPRCCNINVAKCGRKLFDMLGLWQVGAASLLFPNRAGKAKAGVILSPAKIGGNPIQGWGVSTSRRVNKPRTEEAS